MLTSALLLLASPILIAMTSFMGAVANLDFLNPAFSGINDGLGFLYQFMQMLNPILPYNHQLIVLNIIIGYYVALFTFRAISWVVRKIPFLGIS